MQHKIANLKKLYEDVWCKGDLTAIRRHLAPDARSRGIMGDMPFAQDDYEELVTMIRDMLGPIEITMPVTVEQDDYVSALIEIKSHGVDTGDPVHLFGQVIARFREHRIIEMHVSTDSLTLFEQLDLLPQNAMAVMLGGTQLR